jgi:hypothetical protein
MLFDWPQNHQPSMTNSGGARHWWSGTPATASPHEEVQNCLALSCADQHCPPMVWRPVKVRG